METINLREAIASENLTAEVQNVLRFIGDIVTRTPRCDDEDEGFDYEFPNATHSLLICGDDAWGGVTAADVIDGHLVLTANYGDEGEYGYSLTDCSGANKIGLHSIMLGTTLDELTNPGTVRTLVLPADSGDKLAKLMGDYLETGIETGIGYWAEARNIITSEDHGCLSAEIRPRRDEEGLPYEDGDPRNDWQRIDAKVMEAAMLRVINENLCNKTLREWILSDYLDPVNCGYLDAETSDVVIQVAVFGEIVFG